MDEYDRFVENDVRRMAEIDNELVALLQGSDDSEMTATHLLKLVSNAKELFKSSKPAVQLGSPGQTSGALRAPSLAASPRNISNKFEIFARLLARRTGFASSRLPPGAAVLFKIERRHIGVFFVRSASSRRASTKKNAEMAPFNLNNWLRQMETLRTSSIPYDEVKFENVKVLIDNYSTSPILTQMVEDNR